jgi:hypothetical protein
MGMKAFLFCTADFEENETTDFEENEQEMGLRFYD